MSKKTAATTVALRPAPFNQRALKSRVRTVSHALSLNWKNRPSGMTSISTSLAKP